MQTTPNLGLKKPEANDTVNVDDLNYNADVLDQEVAARIKNSGNTPSIQAGLDAAKPAAGTAGRLYVATDTQIIYRDTGTAWQKVGVVKWGDIDGKPASFTPAVHGNEVHDPDLALASDLAAHLAETAQDNDVHGLKTLFQNQQFANLIKNGDFASWSNGDTSLPDGWSSNGALSVSKSTDLPENTQSGFSVKLSSLQGWFYNNSIGKLKKNTKYTLIFDMKKGADFSSSDWFHVDLYGGGWDTVDFVTLPPEQISIEWTRYYGTITTPNTDLTSDTVVRFYIIQSATVSGDIYIANVVLVEGELPVAFANHPNDQHLKAVDYQDSAGTNYEYGLLSLQTINTIISLAAVTNASKSITFPKAFTKVLGAWAITTSSYYSVGITALNTTGATVHIRHVLDSVITADIPVYVIALGVK
ncbi:MAG: hypothetical protein AB1523_00325 [Bacillota bacterium]